jgi:2,3-bisphosphoglycerate-dependent phosphoglycerate mutase
MTKAKLVILRHGQTEYNKLHLMTGQRDVPLTEEGEEQAREAGRLLDAIVFDKAYSSTLRRAFNTAALALKESKNNDHILNAIEQRPEIMEIDAGDFTGRNYRTDPEVTAFIRDFNTPRPRGESDADLVKRVRKFFVEDVLPRLEKGENVIIVSHAGTVRAFEIVLDIDAIPEVGGVWSAPKKIPNATPTVYEYDGGKMTGFRRLENSRQAGAANANRPPKAPEIGGL